MRGTSGLGDYGDATRRDRGSWQPDLVPVAWIRALLGWSSGVTVGDNVEATPRAAGFP